MTIEFANRAAVNLHRAADSFRKGNEDRAHTLVWGSMDLLAEAGEGQFAFRGQAIVAYTAGMDPEVPATICERMAADVDELIAGGVIGNR